jgi:hypothetical protein
VATLYEDASEETLALLAATVQSFCPELDRAGVTWRVLIARNDAGPALKNHGYAAAAVVKINSYEARVSGLPDVTLKISEEEWGGLGREGRIALLHHEAHHLVLVMERDANGMPTDRPKRDDLGRPKLKMRLHDVQIGIFTEVAQQHGPASLDHQHVAGLVKQWQQGDFAWG